MRPLRDHLHQILTIRQARPAAAAAPEIEPKFEVTSHVPSADEACRQCGRSWPCTDINEFATTIHEPATLSLPTSQELRGLAAILVRFIEIHRCGMTGCFVCAPADDAAPCAAANTAFNNLLAIRNTQNQRAEEHHT